MLGSDPYADAVRRGQAQVPARAGLYGMRCPATPRPGLGRALALTLVTASNSAPGCEEDTCAV